MGKFDSSLAKNCVYKASSSSTSSAIVEVLNPYWIKSRKSGISIAYRVQLKNPQYFMFSHPLSTFRRSEPYWIGYDDAKFCTQLGLIPTFLLNLNKFTVLRIWGKLAQSLFSPRAEPIPSEGYVYWKLVPKLGRPPELSSMNFILRQNADMKVYEGMGCTCFRDYFTFGFWCFPERGFTDSTIVINDESAIHLVLKACKSLYIPIRTYVAEMDLGLEKQVPVQMLTLWGLVKKEGNYHLQKIDYVPLTKGVAGTFEDEQKRGRFFINGIVTEFRKRETRFPTLTAVALYEVSNLELFMSLIGLVVSQRFQESNSMSKVGTLEDIRQETEHVLKLFLQKASLDTTFADSMPNQFSLAVKYLKPMITASEEEEEVYYMHPSVYITLLENGLIDRLKSRQDIVNVLRLVEMIPEASDVEILRSKESSYLKGRGFFPEIILSSLKTAIRQINLSKILRSCPTKTLGEEIEEDAARQTKQHPEELEQAGRSQDYQPAIEIMGKRERDILRHLRESEKKSRRARRDR